MNNAGDEQRFEERLREIAAQMPYPPAPDVPVSRRLAVAEYRRIHRGAWVAVSVLVVGMVLAVGAVPEIRATLLEILGIGAVELEVMDVSPDVDLPPLRLDGLTTLEDAESLFHFPLKIPRDWGLPDAVYVQSVESGSRFVVMVWGKQSSGEIRALYQAAQDDWRVFKSVDEMALTTVNGQTAVWLTIPHPLRFDERGQSTDGYVVNGNVLIWQVNGITYRLEGMGDIKAAIAAAESLQLLEPDAD